MAVAAWVSLLVVRLQVGKTTLVVWVVLVVGMVTRLMLRKLAVTTLWATLARPR